MPEEKASFPHDRRSEKPNFLTNIKFSQFELPPEVHNGLKDIGFSLCTPIQARTLPLSLAQKDIAGQAQTGTGKTAAFLITIFSRLLTLPDKKGGKKGICPY